MLLEAGNRSNAGGSGSDEDADDTLGIEINEQDTLNGWTPLHLASIGGYVEVIRVLLDNGASKTVRDKVRVPFGFDHC